MDTARKVVGADGVREGRSATAVNRLSNTGKGKFVCRLLLPDGSECDKAFTQLSDCSAHTHPVRGRLCVD